MLFPHVFDLPPNFVIFDISDNRNIKLSLKTKSYILKHKLGNACVYDTECIKDLGGLIDSKLQFNCHVDYIFFSNQ
jgi:hypothetical protein